MPKHIDMEFKRQPHEIINEILGRYSVTDLKEMSADDLRRGDELFYKNSSRIEITDAGETGLIMWWKVESDGKAYEVRRFKNFVWCSCLDFYFKRSMCKHAVRTAGVLCERCGESRAKVGKLCYNCDSNRTAVLKGRIADAPRRGL